MAIKIRTKRLATSATNPRRVARKKKPAKKRTRKLSPKQIKHFGTKRQKAALKARKSPAAKAAKRKRSSNPAWVVTLGQGLTSLNPKRRSSTMAQKKTKKRRKVTAARPKRRVARKNPVKRARRRRAASAPKRRTRRKSNPRVVVRYRTRKNKRRTSRRTSRNPDIFGTRLGSKDSLKMIGGGIVGVASAKFLPTLLPASMLAQVSSSNIAKTAVSLAAALAAGFAASKLDARFGQGVYFGGIMQAASVGLNAFLPSLYRSLNIGMAGVGDFVPGQFAVPQNPVRGQLSAPSHAVAPSGSRVTMSGLARAYQPAY